MAFVRNYQWLWSFAVASCLLVGIPRIKGDLEPVLQQCCSVGSSWGHNHTTCTGPPSPVQGISAEDRSTCYTAIYVCCIRTHRNINCERGKLAARIGQACSALPTPGGEAHKDCCDACSLGLKAGSMRIPCTFSTFAFGPPWDEAYADCCVNAPSVQGTSPLSRKSNNRCETENPCSQKCEDIGNRIQCSCYPGYRLSIDQKTCEDVNECELGTHSCNANTETCLNSIGGFQCLEKETPARQVQTAKTGQCPSGYAKNQERQTCDDVDECSLGVCSESEVCSNTIGSFTCIPRNPVRNCPPGFKQHPSTSRCIDVDECAESIDNCDRDQELCINSYGGYQCEPKSLKSKDCPAGFKWSNTQASCEDVDECTEGIHSCNGETQNCVNAIGSYRCTTKIPECPHGFRRIVNNRCEDINECNEGTNDCDQTNQYCVNTLGSYQCHTKPSSPVQKCGTGFIFDTRVGICQDIDECAEIRPCAQDQTCENVIGSYRCECQQGYTIDPVTKACRDVNECQLGLHSCAHSQRCDNTIGSFSCVRTTSCGTGYTLNAGIGECEDDDECLLGSHNCGPGFVCRNTLGSFRCDRVRCPAGQKLLPDGSCQAVTCNNGMEPDATGNCVDINECSTTNVCRANQRCINTVGSYRCQNLLNCGAGYELNEYGNQCVDIDECVRRIHECGSQQTCRNRPGGYSCECPAGYSLNGDRACEDVDECTRFRGQVCSINSICENTQGSYICNCKGGFKKAEDGRNCVDVDECADSPNICQQNCINVWGSYQCSCRQGFTLAPDERSCQDIDECSIWEGRGSLCIGFCINEPGSYSCSCPEGYRLAPDKRTCQDIDECQEQNVCKGENEVCLNTRGSFKCNIISCPSNYARDRDHRNRCKRSSLDCREGDADCLKEPISFSYNYITFVSNMRIPPSGQLDLFTMRGPRFTITTVQFSLELKDARAPKGITPANKEYFHLRRTAFNEAMVSLVKTIPGPQEIELELLMKMYHNGLFGGTAVAKIFIFVTRHEF